MKKNYFIGLFILFLAFPAFASAKTILSARTYGGFCLPPGCPERIVKLNVDAFGWGYVQEIKKDAENNITEKVILAWLPPSVVNKIKDAINKVEKSELYDTEKDEPMIADIPETEYKIIKDSKEKVIIGKNSMGHLWMQKNHRGHSLIQLITSFSLLNNVSPY